MVFLVWGRDTENIEKKKKTERRKTFKNEENWESQITINIFGFIFYMKKSHFARKNSLKKPSPYHHILFTVFMRCRVFET